MKISRMAILVAATAILMLATATSAFAASNGTVYGQATMTSTISLELGASGFSVDQALIYNGTEADEDVPELNGQQVWVKNTGANDVRLFLNNDSDPYNNVTEDSYALGSAAGDTVGVWTFTQGLAGSTPHTVPAEGEAPTEFASLAADSDAMFDNSFSFPTVHYEGDFTMTTLITAQ